MPTVQTYNSSANDMTLLGIASNKVYLTTPNLLGVGYNEKLPFPSHTTPTPVNLTQELGLVPLLSCNDDECRSYPEHEYINLVLGDLTDSDNYKNDFNTFSVTFQAWYSVLFSTSIVLQEYASGTWTTIDTLYTHVANVDTINTNYGICIPYNTYTSHPDICGYQIQWRKVLNIFGEGIYRICFTITGIITDYCGCSVPFCLKTYSCTNAMNTVKFELTMKDGTIGDHEIPSKLWDICGITYTDSIRFEGFFGYEKDEYEQKNVEYNNGIIYKVRNEVIKKFDLQTGRLPKWLHDRFRAYALMADTLLVSDYNYNNPDYNIKRKGLVTDGGYEPVWVQNTRYARVKVSFKEDQQNLIRRRCCQREGGAAG